MTVGFNDRQRVMELKDIVTKEFTTENWLELGHLTGFYDRVQAHSRLFRSMSWGDADYPGNVTGMLMNMADENPKNVDIMADYVGEKFGFGGGTTVSSVPVKGKRIYFTPSVFEAPGGDPDPNLLSVMMPFSAQFRSVYASISEVAAHYGLECKRADDIWEHATVIQDIFSLIYRSYIVVCDFTQRNANVFYEAGIAHTLGKHVIPLAQNIEDIPFDLRHHRILTYLPNAEGLRDMQCILDERIQYLVSLRGK